MGVVWKPMKSMETGIGADVFEDAGVEPGQAVGVRVAVANARRGLDRADGREALAFADPEDLGAEALRPSRLSSQSWSWLVLTPSSQGSARRPGR